MALSWTLLKDIIFKNSCSEVHVVLWTLRYTTHNSSILRYCAGKLDCYDLNILNFWAFNSGLVSGKPGRPYRNSIFDLWPFHRPLWSTYWIADLFRERSLLMATRVQFIVRVPWSARSLLPLLDGCPLIFLWVSVSSSFAIISWIFFRVVLA